MKGWIILFLLLVCAGLVWGLSHRRMVPERQIGAQLGTVALVYSNRLVDTLEGRGGGELEQLVLRLSFPDFTAVDDEAAAKDRQHLIYVTLRAPESPIPPDDRPMLLYARFLSAEVIEEPSGLVLRQFEAATPYTHEELYLAPPEGRDFAAMCPKQGFYGDKLPDSCLTDLRFDHLDVQIRFDRSLLEQWQGLTSGVRKLVESLEVHRKPAASMPVNAQ